MCCALVAEDRSDQYYGTRCLVWARLLDKATNQVVFAASHHGPLPVDTGGKTGGAAVAARINEVITSKMQSGDTVILGGDFNAHNWFTTVTTLRDTYGYNLRKSEWVDHIFTKGAALDATPQITVIPKGSTGSDHDGLKLTWTNGLGGGGGSGSTDANPSPESCGYIPSSCNSDLGWAISSGKYSHPEYYPNFQSVTGVALSSASQNDMVAYWVCTDQNPRGNCGGLELPCGWGSCPSQAFEIESEQLQADDASNNGDLVKWILIALGVAIGVVLCVLMVFCVWRRAKVAKQVQRDDVGLRSDEQLKSVDDQMIELEESVEDGPVAEDGNAETIGVMA